MRFSKRRWCDTGKVVGSGWCDELESVVVFAVVDGDFATSVGSRCEEEWER